MVKLRPMKKSERGPGVKAGSRFLPLGLIAGPAGGLVSALLKNWKLAIFAILVGFIFYQNYVSFELLKPFGFRTIPGVLQDSEDQIRVLTAQLAECESSRENLKGAIQATNDQIQKWVDLSSKLQANQTQLSTALVDLKKKSTAELEIILQGPIPQTCEGAVKLLREAVTKGELSWKPGG